MVTFFRMAICTNDIHIEGTGAMCGSIHQFHYNPLCQRAVELHPTSQSRQPAFHAKAESGTLFHGAHPNEDVCGKFSGIPVHHHTGAGLPGDDHHWNNGLGFTAWPSFGGVLPTQHPMQQKISIHFLQTFDDHFWKRVQSVSIPFVKIQIPFYFIFLVN